MRYVEGKALDVYYRATKLHAVPEERIKALTSLGMFRPAVCGARVIPQRIEIVINRMVRPFLKPFDPDDPNACKTCLKNLQKKDTLMEARAPRVNVE